MKLVIDIPEEVYDRCKEYRLQCGEAEVLESAVARGESVEQLKQDMVEYLETQLSWEFYDDWGNSNDLHDILMDAIMDYNAEWRGECDNDE